MKTLKVGICFLDDEDNVITKRVVGTNWTVNVEQDLKKNFNIHMMDEIASILTENIKLQLTDEVIREMITEVQEREKE